MADIVYVLKESDTNPELVYSLRSVEKNFPHDRVVFYGGKPMGLEPDYSVRMEQYGTTKWKRVANMLMHICSNRRLSEDIWLFNDDFFVMLPFEDEQPMYDGTLAEHILHIERRHQNLPTTYTMQLRHAMEALEDEGLPTLNYAVHMPMRINRAKMRETLERFKDVPMFRSMYGNMWRIGGVNVKDCKIVGLDRLPLGTQTFVSTDDKAFANGAVGEYIRERFTEPSRWEVK